jgi:multisubunit Na+/H+ antiporter MnhG subunit
MTVGVYGAIRMPDTYAKLHSMSKAVFLGVVALFASSVVTGDPRIMDRTLGRALEKKPATEVAPRHPDDMLREAS